MKEKKNVPKLRFPEFTEEWDLKCVGEMTEEDSDYTTLASRLPLFTSSRSGLIYQNEYRSSQTTESKETLFSVVPRGHCTYRHMSDDDVFHLNINTLEKGLVSREYPVFHANESNRLGFLVQYMNSSERFRSFCKGQKKGGTRTRLYYKALCEFKMCVPAIGEQNRVADFIDNFDTLINLQHRKLDQIKEYKKGMLQKMFPKDGESVPEVRFPEFTGKWEQRKLGKLLRTLPYKPYLKAPEKDGRYEIIQQGNDPIIGFANGTPCEDYRRAVIFGDHTLSLYKPQKPFFVATDGVRILQGVNDMDGNYLLHLLEKNKPQSEGYKRYYSILADKEVFFSANHNEQIQIGLYFKRLDTLITLQQRKLDAMKEYKKGLLQQMFV